VTPERDRLGATLLGLGGDETEVLEPRRIRAGSARARVLPYLGHGRKALWDPDPRGDRRPPAHGREDVARRSWKLVLESRRCIEVLDAAGVAPIEIRAAGGAFASGLFPELLAGATARPVLLPEDGAASARGAALLGAASVGDADVPALAASAAHARIDPDPATAPRWTALWERHERARASVATSSGEAA
jgi:sugar (pentulose or hexulose) kinase